MIKWLLSKVRKNKPYKITVHLLGSYSPHYFDVIVEKLGGEIVTIDEFGRGYRAMVDFEVCDKEKFIVLLKSRLIGDWKIISYYDYVGV